MANKSRNRKNQPPSLVGKKQPRRNTPKLAKRSEVLQAARNHPELNLGDADDDAAARAPVRQPAKAGR